jgi:hypothetical protein
MQKFMKTSQSVRVFNFFGEHDFEIWHVHPRDLALFIKMSENLATQIAGTPSVNNIFLTPTCVCLLAMRVRITSTLI